MEIKDETIQIVAKDIFREQLFSIYKKFDVPEHIYITKESIVNELSTRKEKENNVEKINSIPLIGKMIYRSIPRNYYKSSAESEFILSLMNHLDVDYLDNNIIKEIWENREAFYEKYYREKRESESRKRLQSFKSQGIKIKKKIY